jgi:hypothetical protein
MTDNTSSFDLSAAELATANANLPPATKLREATDAAKAQAQATLAAAVDAHGALASKMASGVVIQPADAARAATAVRDAEAHLALATSAQAIALAKENACLDEQAEAVFNHDRHIIAQKHRERAVKCRELAAAASAFEAAVEAWAASGHEFMAVQQAAHVRRATRLGPAFLQSWGGVDKSRTSYSNAGAALPTHLLLAIRQNALDHIDFMAAAAVAESEADRVAR